MTCVKVGIHKTLPYDVYIHQLYLPSNICAFPCKNVTINTKRHHYQSPVFRSIQHKLNIWLF